MACKKDKNHTLHSQIVRHRLDGLFLRWLVRLYRMVHSRRMELSHGWKIRDTVTTVREWRAALPKLFAFPRSIYSFSSTENPFFSLPHLWQRIIKAANILRHTVVNYRSCWFLNGMTVLHVHDNPTIWYR